MLCDLLGLCKYETNKLVRIQSVRLGSLKWALNATILVVICIMMLWNRNYQEFDLVVSSVTTKVKGVAQPTCPGSGNVVWDVVDYSGPSQDKNSFFVVTNVIVTQSQRQGKCAEVPSKGRLCRTDRDCEKGHWDQQSHGIQTGSCVKFDVLKKTCEVSAWCPVEAKTKPPRPALLAAAAENFTVLIKNNIRFPAFNYIRRNILPQMNDAYLRNCQRTYDPLCPIFRLGDIVREAGEKFSDIAIEVRGLLLLLVVWEGVPKTGGGGAESPITHCVELSPWGFKEMGGGRTEGTCGCLRSVEVLEVCGGSSMEALDPSSAVLDILELLNALARDPDEECVAVVQPGGDKGVDQFFCVCEGESRNPPSEARSW
ncbi:LOW QUALITY PROTEIN: P2X purinoceptor 4-like [Scomber japonicus]|uniref:LOW QUALITY PROTEIN: P2X purinoceptor 4-like n=1 Tax=Scomber japonicus TaxID=13676 RepID=UPI002304F983|nr:LOW QUALITY PROTEIN: P2X purinoceptor 4-like [Scomber japonicus]